MLDHNAEEQTTTAVVPHNAPTAEQFIQLIGAAYSKGVEAWIEVGRLLAQAKKDLPYGQFTKMVAEDMPFDERTAERFMAIAKNPVLADPTHVSVLPPHWGTLYELNKVPVALLEQHIEDGTIHPGMERKDAVALNPKHKLRSSSGERPSVQAKNKELRAELAAQKEHITELEAAREQTTLSITAVREQYADLLRRFDAKGRAHELKELKKLIDQKEGE
jgi:hypothetical protein